MALTTPTPPAGAARGLPDLAGMIALMGGADAKSAQLESMTQVVRQALKILSDLEDLTVKHPEVLPVVQAVAQAKFNTKSKTARTQPAPSPQVPLAGGVPGAPTPVPPQMGALAAPPPPVVRPIPQY